MFLKLVICLGIFGHVLTIGPPDNQPGNQPDTPPGQSTDDGQPGNQPDTPPGQLCEDHDSRYAIEESGESVSYESCAALVARWPIVCDPHYGNTAHKYCCVSCRGVDYTCRNSPVSIQSGDSVLVCSDLIGGYRAFCANKQVMDNCCEACKPDTGDPPLCVDFPGPLYQGKTCMEMASEYGCRFCANEETDTGKYCCDSCKPYTSEVCADPITPGCKNDRDWSIPGPGGESIICKKLSMPKYQCMCAHHYDSCCKTCSEIDLNECKSDCKGWTQEVRGETYYSDCSVVEKYPYFYLNECKSDCKGWTQEVRGETYYSDCSVVEKYPYFCTFPSFYNPEGLGATGAGYCCQTCAKLEKKKKLRCANNPLSTFGVGENSYTCEQLPESAPCQCEQPEARQLCCEACKGVDLNKCGCKNLVFKRKPYEVLGKNFTSCKTLVKEHPYFCTQDEFVGEGGLCCQACMEKDTTCVDEPLLLTIGSKSYTCKDFRTKLPYLCINTSVESAEGYRDRCCKSCQNAKLECTNNPHWEHDIPRLDKKNKVYPHKTCQGIKKVPDGLQRVCCGDMFNAKKECCKTCQNVQCPEDDANVSTDLQVVQDVAE